MNDQIIGLLIFIVIAFLLYKTVKKVWPGDQLPPNLPPTNPPPNGGGDDDDNDGDEEEEL